MTGFSVDGRFSVAFFLIFPFLYVFFLFSYRKWCRFFNIDICCFCFGIRLPITLPSAIDNIFEIKWTSKLRTNKDMKIIDGCWFETIDFFNLPNSSIRWTLRQSKMKSFLLMIIFIKKVFGSTSMCVACVFSWILLTFGHARTHLPQSYPSSCLWWTTMWQRECWTGRREKKEVGITNRTQSTKIRTFKCKWNSRNTFSFKPDL